MPGANKIFRFIFFIGAVFTLVSCHQNESATDTPTLFTLIPSSESDVDFKNELTEDDQFNIIQYLYFYNGGGVAVGDINNDGLDDLYFSSNQKSNKLYLNKGNFHFEEITEKAGVAGIGNWSTGVTMADVNGDGLLDIFVCGVGGYKSFNGRNILYINNGDLTFSDKTEDYGLAFQGFSTHATFFDYDNDGDLDMYLLNHAVHTARSYGDVSLRFQSDPQAGDKLYRNDLIPDGVNHFSEVTTSAGIANSQIGYGLGVGVSDLNKDGFLDIYVSNDFHESDYLYLNQHNGTFKQVIENTASHVSRFSMGNDIADVNNDDWPDIFTLDMLPQQEGVLKSSAGEDPYEVYQYKLRFGYFYQIARNALQLNRGTYEDTSPLFSDVALLAGVASTDWSWSPLLADFDDDGYKDIFIANGIQRRPNDLDYINYINDQKVQQSTNDFLLIDKMPKGEVPNFFYKGKNDLTYQDVSRDWIGTIATSSNGAVYSDLDNDGDLDLVVNNINREAFLYRNDIRKDSSNYLNIELKGSGLNIFGVGSKVMVWSGRNKFYTEQIPSRGWMSSVSYTLHLGLGKSDVIDSLIVIWPSGKFEKVINQRPNQKIILQEKDALDNWNYKPSEQKKLLKEVEDFPFVHRENEFDAISVERLMPGMLTTQGPKMSVGDLNGDKLDDVFVGGAAGQPGAVFIQNKNGKFERTKQLSIASDSLAEDVDSEFFDADSNGTLDLIVVGGGQEFPGNHVTLRPRLYLNDGNGLFRKVNHGLSDVFVNASCVKVTDVDGDGDEDIFIGGRVVPGYYGNDPSSFLLINNGAGQFTDESFKLYADSTGSLGMVSDAAWTDINNDNRPDLIVVGEWMPVTILLQDEQGKFVDHTNDYGCSETNGWWNTIESADFDKDGDIDFVLGNLGLNSRLKASPDHPVSLYVSDIDKNGSLDQILTYYNDGVQYPFVSRDQLIKQIPALKKKYVSYSTYGNVKVEDLFGSGFQDVKRKDAFMFSSIYMENEGGKFKIKVLPQEAQVSPIFAFGIDDLNNDGFKDLIAVGNLNAIQPDFGRYDGLVGLVMLGDGKGKFNSQTIQESGFYISGEGRDIKFIRNVAGEKLILISRNNAMVKKFRKSMAKTLP